MKPIAYNGVFRKLDNVIWV